jgi:hypothetical protein
VASRSIKIATAIIIVVAVVAVLVYYFDYAPATLQGSVIVDSYSNPLVNPTRMTFTDLSNGFMTSAVFTATGGNTANYVAGGLTSGHSYDVMIYYNEGGTSGSFNWGSIQVTAGTTTKIFTASVS